MIFFLSPRLRGHHGRACREYVRARSNGHLYCSHELTDIATADTRLYKMKPTMYENATDESYPDSEAISDGWPTQDRSISFLRFPMIVSELSYVHALIGSAKGTCRFKKSFT